MSKRIGEFTHPLGQLTEQIEDARYAFDRLDTLPDARHRLERAIEVVLSLAYHLSDAAEDDAEDMLFEWLADTSEDSLAAPTT